MVGLVYGGVSSIGGENRHPVVSQCQTLSHTPSEQDSNL
jgi:hypothetical protein